MYPIMINIQNKKVVIIGGGNIAARKIKALLKENANITVVSPTIHPSIDLTLITYIKDNYHKKYLDGATLIFACTNNQKINNQIMLDAHPYQLVNNTGDKTYSDFYNVAIVSKQDFSVAISTNGTSPARSKEVRKKLESLLDTI